MIDLYRFARPLLFMLPSEASHHVALKSLSLLNAFQAIRQTTGNVAIKCFGLNFENRIGCAAGLDKNGDYIDALGNLGFGHIEIGTLTPRPQKGNEKPRLFRLKQDKAIINRMGFNNFGVDAAIQKLKRRRYQGILGVNIGKNKVTPNEKAIDDYVYCMQKVYDYCDYITINISSPNTPNLRELQHEDNVSQLLNMLKQEQTILAKRFSKYVPLILKIAPDLNDVGLAAIAQQAIDKEIDAIIATNTTITRPTLYDKYQDEKGGLSGKPLMAISTETLARLHSLLQGKIPLIGVGGVVSADDAKHKLEAGADLVQLYSGLIFEGPSLIRNCIEATNG